ncbi:MAG: YARHG domain-containing protein [Deltaproteobacteria bacterium]|nr:YARHG domain-containing protein [Deltaproteobacteria bacterium]
MDRVSTIVKSLLTMLIVSGATSGLSHAATKKTVLHEFTQLMQSNCDVKQFGIHTPMEARILRNVPYALAGYTFSAEELTTLFAGDGGWYTPTSAQLPVLKPEYRACVERLLVREKETRTLLRIDPEIEKILTGDPRIFLSLRREARPDSVYRNHHPGKKSAHTVEWGFRNEGPTSCGGNGSRGDKTDCTGATIYCERPDSSTHWRDFRCQIIWAG